MKRNVRTGSSKVLFLALTGLVIVGIAVFILYLRTDAPQDSRIVPENSEDTEEPTDADTAWVTYTNETYGFSIDHPSDWEVTVTERDQFTTMINFYPEGSDTSKLPYTHHSEQVSHVSVFPKGIPTEGFFGQAEDSNVDFGVPVARATDYVLANGASFATLAFLEADHERWTDWGFLFAHAVPTDVTTTCYRGSEVMGPYECDPLMGDTIVREGEVADELRSIEVRMLESFEFTE